MSDDERRAVPREQAYVAAELSVNGGPLKLAVVQDASEMGLRLLTHTQVKVGDPVEVAVQIAAERRIEVSGTAARSERLEGAGPWRYRIGVALAEASEELGREAAAISRKQSPKP